MRHLGPVELVDLDPAALVRVQARRLEIQVVGPALPGRVHDRVGRDPLAAAQVGDGALGQRLDRLHGLAEPERHGQVAQVVLERLDHFEVAELQHPVALLDDRDLGAQGGEHGRVLDADHPGAGDDHGPGHPLQLQHAVGVDHGTVVELDAGRPGRLGPGRDHDVLGGDPVDMVAAVVHLDRVRIREVRRSGDHRHPVTGELAAHHVDLPADHVLGAGGQVGDGDLVLDPVGLPVHLALIYAGEVEHRLPERLGRDRAGVQAHPADHVRPLHHGDLALQLGRGDRRLLPARPGPDHQQFTLVHASQCDQPPRPREPPVPAPGPPEPMIITTLHTFRPPNQDKSPQILVVPCAKSS